MLARCFLAAALIACLGGAAPALAGGSIVFKSAPGGVGLTVTRGVGTWLRAPVGEVAVPGVAVRVVRDRHRSFGRTLGDARAARWRTARGGRGKVIRLDGFGVRAFGPTPHGGLAFRPRPVPGAAARRHGLDLAAVGDLEFGIDDHRHDHHRGILRRHRGRDAFRVPEHRFLQDRFVAPHHRLDRGTDVRRHRLDRGRHFGTRPVRPRRLRCDTALGASVLAFC